MTVGDAILLGIIQGITEFLPISSSGHLVVAENLMGLSKSGIIFEVVVHLGTLISILVVFRKDLTRLLRNWTSDESRRMSFYLVIGTIPIVLVGSMFKSQIEIAFEMPSLVGMAFLVTGSILILTYFTRVSGNSEMNTKRSILIGLSQALAILPGISRSGITISSGLILGMEAKEAARFSFFLAIPALLGSGFFMMGEILSMSGDGESMRILITGFVTSFLIGLIALKFLLSVLVKGKFYWFGIYCWVIGIISIGI